MRFQNCGRNLVVLRHRAVYSEYDRLLFRWKVRSSHRALHALDAHMGPVNHIGHYGRIVSQSRRLVSGTLSSNIGSEQDAPTGRKRRVQMAFKEQ